MVNILVHGLGQNHTSWKETQQFLLEKGIVTVCPDLFGMNRKNEMIYTNLYRSFADYCNQQKEKLNLCGLSLGGILVLQYAKEHPENVNSIVLIGTPDKIPKTLFKIQNLVFRVMPKKTFEKIGTTKKEFCALVNSMVHLEIADHLEKVKCKTLLVCGAQDQVNMKSARRLQTNIVGSKLKVIAHASHEVNIDNPKELGDLLCDFWMT